MEKKTENEQKKTKTNPQKRKWAKQSEKQKKNNTARPGKSEEERGRASKSEQERERAWASKSEQERGRASKSEEERGRASKSEQKMRELECDQKTRKNGKIKKSRQVWCFGDGLDFWVLCVPSLSFFSFSPSHCSFSPSHFSLFSCLFFFFSFPPSHFLFSPFYFFHFNFSIFILAFFVLSNPFLAQSLICGHSLSFFVLSFLSSRSVPPILSIPFAFPSNSLMYYVSVYSPLLCRPFFHCMFLLFSLSFSLSLSFSIFLLFFISCFVLFFFLSSLSVFLSILSLSLNLSMSREKEKQKWLKQETNWPKRDWGGNSRRKSQHMRTRSNRILKKGHLRVWAGSKDPNNVSRFPENDWDRGIKWYVYTCVSFPER